MSAFLVDLLGRLEPDAVDVLIYQTQMMRNSSLGPYDPADFSPPEHIVLVNALFYASLGVMLLTAFIAMLIKSWVREFDRGLHALKIPEQRAKTREFRYLGMVHWKLADIVAVLPFLIQVSLVLFAIGLVIFLRHISIPSFGVTTAIFGIGVLYYATTTAISIFVTSSPFHSPLSRALGKVYRRAHAYFCPGLDKFLSPDMDTTPVTFLGPLGRRFQIFLQKSRPYLEKDFEYPIAATTVDEIQLSTTASALRRIHDSVPNSQHSELVHRSVWRVAGSPALRMQPLFNLPSWIFERGNDKEYFSRLSPASLVALIAVFVRIRDPRYKRRIGAVADIRRAISDAQEPWAHIVHAMFDLLPDDYDALLHPAPLRDAALFRDAVLRDALRNSPLLDTLRNALLRNALLRNAPLRDAPRRDAPRRDAPRREILSHLLDIVLHPRRTPRRNLCFLVLSVILIFILLFVPMPFTISFSILFITLSWALTLTLVRMILIHDASHRNALLRILEIVRDPRRNLRRNLLFLGLSSILITTLAFFLLNFVSGSILVPFLALCWAFEAGTLRYARRALLVDDAHLRNDALLRDVPLNDPSLIHFRGPFLRVLVYVYALLRDALEDASLEAAVFDAVFCDFPVSRAFRLLGSVVRNNADFDGMTVQGRIRRAYIEPEEPDDLINILRKNQPQEEESIWLLNTLSGLHCDGLVLTGHHVSKICLTLLLHQAPEWNQQTPPNVMLIEAVVTLAAIACSSNESYQRKILTNSHQHPWLLLNLRDPQSISRMVEDIDYSCRNELISLLFLIIYAFILRGSNTLAVWYIDIITSKCDFPFCASALAVIAPVLGDDGFSAIGGLLLAPQTQFLTPKAGGSMSDFPQLGFSYQCLFDHYDLRLAASQSPDPKHFVILLLLSKNRPSGVGHLPRSLHLPLRNSWLRLAAKVIARVNIPDESGLNNVLFHDHRVHNMIAALSLRRHPARKPCPNYQYMEPLLFASFLESRELAISSLALHHYMSAVRSSSNPRLQHSGPSCRLSGAVHAVFSPVLPAHYLPEGWKILEVFDGGFEELSVEWRQSFAEAFFTLSRRSLLRGKSHESTPITDLEDVLTWEYFCEEEREPELSDSEFSGLDWMATAWSLDLSQRSGTNVTVSEQREPRSSGLRDPPENEEFVLRVLYRLLGAAPDYSINPIVPQLHEFVERFDDPKLSEYRSMISAMTAEAVHRHQERNAFDKFQKFHCIWYP